ncbi:MAG: hypothetical protein RIG63_17870 [Coleofasciculus chthonoplastes F3-SA18-01]|uniref:hypothetical protein n=1 Tax=Coleofasciculus chthonoplastes TaxID=64178 RepID=UPI003304487C
MSINSNATVTLPRDRTILYSGVMPHAESIPGVVETEAPFHRAVRSRYYVWIVNLSPVEKEITAKHSPPTRTNVCVETRAGGFCLCSCGFNRY